MKDRSNSMKQTPNAGSAAPYKPGFALSDSVTQLVSSLSVIAGNSRTSLSNRIEAGFWTAADEKQVLPVLSEILTVMLLNARNGQIQVFAGKFRDVVIVDIEEKNNYNGYALACSVHSLEPLVRMTGGVLSIRGAQRLHTTVTFTFPDSPMPAPYEC